jgi:hypothetical protein
LGIFVVLIIIGSWPTENYPDDPPIGPRSETPVENDLTQDEINSLKSENPTGNEIYNRLQLEDRQDQPAAVEGFNYSGKWWVWENDIRVGYFMIAQNGNFFNFEYYYFDQKIADGTGEYDGTYLYSTNFNFYEDNQEYAFSFGSNDLGKSWMGQTYVNGQPTNARLIKG